MLFYEAVEASASEIGGASSNGVGNPASSFSSASPEDMSSITSTATDRSAVSDTSRATSVSTDGVDPPTEKGVQPNSQVD